jgi:hypothetical protein
MRSVPLPPLLPRLNRQDREGANRKPRRSPEGKRPPLSLPQLPEPSRRDVVFGMSSIDCGGRITGRTVMGSLEWSPGDRIRFNVREGLIVAMVDSLGHRDLGAHGVLLLPVEVRRACRLQAGDRILLAALPTQQRLILHPPATLATLTAALHDTATGGGRR